MTEKVLIEARKKSDGAIVFAGRVWAPGALEFHPHPGVPVADLVEEVDALWAWFADHMPTAILKTRYSDEHWEAAQELRAAREAAKEPKEAWIKVQTGDGFRAVNVRTLRGGIMSFEPHPDDIRTDD